MLLVKELVLFSSFPKFLGKLDKGMMLNHFSLLDLFLDILVCILVNEGSLLVLLFGFKIPLLRRLHSEQVLKRKIRKTKLRYLVGNHKD